MTFQAWPKSTTELVARRAMQSEFAMKWVLGPLRLIFPYYCLTIVHLCFGDIGIDRSEYEITEFDWVNG